MHDAQGEADADEGADADLADEEAGKLINEDELRSAAVDAVESAWMRSDTVR